MPFSRRPLLAGMATIPLSISIATEAQAIESRAASGTYRATPVIEGLNAPWSLCFLPDGRRLITEKPGRLLVFEPDSSEAKIVSGTPAVFAQRQGGLLDVVADPEFAQNHHIYLSFSATGEGGAETEVVRAVLESDRLTNVTRIFAGGPKSSGGAHFGCRLAFDNASLLYITYGDRGQMDRAQDLGDAAGKIHRIAPDGSIPTDNPFVGRDDVQPTIFTYGNRTPQGIARHPSTGAIWAHEHGPRGGDEVNVLQSGANYGWPEITYGINYNGTEISPDTHRDGMVQPLWFWTPSIAPCGMAFKMQPEAALRQELYVGALAGSLLARLTVTNSAVIEEERLFEFDLGRVRDVREGPDGALYCLTDDSGICYRIDKI